MLLLKYRGGLDLGEEQRGWLWRRNFYHPEIRLSFLLEGFPSLPPRVWLISKTFPCDFFFLIFIGVWLSYNVVLVSGIQQSESVVHILIYTLFLHYFPI